MKTYRYSSSLLFIFILLISFTSKLQAKEILQYNYEVVNVYPHDATAFTQGLVFHDGYLYESAGQFGHSSLRKVDLETGKIINRINIDKQYFAEGLTRYKQQLVQLSWRAGKAFIYDLDSFKQLKTFNYKGQGWGLTHYENYLIMSDGSSRLRFLDPSTFNTVNELNVSIDGRSVKKLNELEMVKGQIFANVWQTDRIVIISPDTGEVTGVVDLTGLLKKHAPAARANVLNGIAYDAKNDRLFVTGKYWPKLFEIKLIKSTPSS